MAQKQTVIYTARTVQDAYLVKNLLSDAGISAVVLNEVLAGGSGVDLPGWATSPKVVVDEMDAPNARQIASRFDRTASETPGEGLQDEEVTGVIDAWPQCPQCRQPRSTRCPVCRTAGSDFPVADMGFVLMTALGDPTGKDLPVAPSCGCGHDGCSSSADQNEPAPMEEEPAGAPRTILMCPTCDEPFEPEYPRRCEWCGHAFDDGFEVEMPSGEVEQISARIVAAIVGLLALLAALAGYFMYLV